MWETAWVAVKMSSVAYLLPFLIVFMPSLLLLGTPYEIAIDSITALVGLLLIITAIQGWALYLLSWPERLCFFAVGACLVWPDGMIRSVAAVLALVLGIYTVMRSKRRDNLSVL
jgi:TRAP-type uncharacterized transport system fused permease subunit